MPSRKKKLSSAAFKLKKHEKKFNPFEVRVNKKKHEVIGQKTKCDKGLPGVARSKAVKKRKKTLLVEYKQRNKANQFIDRRFGEYNDELSVEEKMMQRFTLERKRKRERSGSFNLNDNEEGLTHFGQSIGDMEKFDHIVLSDNDDLGEEDIGDTHFGGFLTKKRPRLADREEEEVSKPRTRKEVMEEVIAKSKAMKFKQQKEKHDVEDLLEKVNSEWKTLQSSLPKAGDKEGGHHTPGDAYDRMVRELAFERRGNPTDRLKTEQEAANEEKERLVNLESHRLRRMKGLSEDAQEEVVFESADYIHDTPARKKTVQFSLEYKDGELVLPAGDNSDNEELRTPSDGLEVEGVGAGSDGVEGAGADSDEGSATDSEDSELGDPGVMYNSDLDSEPSEEESNDELDGERSEVNKPVPKETKEAASQELPYTFTVPESLQDLQTIMVNRSPEECLTAVERIHACNHPSISPANKQKLVAFLPVIIDYCVSLGVDLSVHNLTVLNKLSRPLFKLSHLNPLHTAGVFRRMLQQSRSKWLTNSPGNKYPDFPELLLFKLIGLIFPTSDYKHPVTTPTLIFMGQLLLKCHVKSVDDLVKGLFVCQTAVEFLSQSKRFIPEAVNFLTSAVACFVKGKEGTVFPPFSANTRSLLSAPAENIQSTGECAKLLSLVELLVECKEDKVPPIPVCSILTHILLALSQLVPLYSDLPSFSELFAPVSTNLKHVLKGKWPHSIQQSLREVSEEISSRGAKSKGVLQLLKQKPKSIKFYEPKFDEVYEVNRKKARTKAIGEKQKLKNKVTKETKGAKREIRRDTAFLAKERLRETLQLDAERAAKTKRIIHDLQMGQHEAKMERRKKRK